MTMEESVKLRSVTKDVHFLTMDLVIRSKALAITDTAEL